MSFSPLLLSVSLPGLAGFDSGVCALNQSMPCKGWGLAERKGPLLLKKNPLTQWKTTFVPDGGKRAVKKKPFNPSAETLSYFGEA